MKLSDTRYLQPLLPLTNEQVHPSEEKVDKPPGSFSHLVNPYPPQHKGVGFLIKPGLLSDKTTWREESFSDLNSPLGPELKRKNSDSVQALPPARPEGAPIRELCLLRGLLICHFNPAWPECNVFACPGD